MKLNNNTKKIFFIEFDKNGNEIYKEEIADVTSGGLTMVGYNLQFQKCNGRQDLYLDKNIRDEIPNEWWIIVKQFNLQLIKFDKKGNAHIYKETLEFIKWYMNLDKRFKYEIHSHMENDCGGGCIEGEIVQLMKATIHKLTWDCSNLNSTLAYIMNCEGEYYAINNSGEKTWYYGLEKPTLKQVKYQRKNGKRMIKYIPKTGETILITESEYK